MVFTYDYVGVGQSFPKTAAAAANDDAGQKVKYLQSIAHVDIESWAADLDCILEWFYRQQITIPHQHQPVRRRQLVYISHSVHIEYYMKHFNHASRTGGRSSAAAMQEPGNGG
jgi:hypothetical protein